MPRQATNIVNSTIPGVKTHTKHVTGWDPGWSTSAGVQPTYISWYRVPDQVENPVRGDGTRAISAYRIDRLLADLPSANIHQTSNGRWGYFTVESERAAYITDLLSGDGVSDSAKILPTDLWMTNVDAIARTNFLKKLAERSGKGRVQLGAMAGEVRETIGMVKDLTEGLTRGLVNTARSVSLAPALAARALDNVKKSGVRDTANRFLHGDVNRLDRLIQSWLVVQFGLKPLTHDIFDMVVYLSAAQQASGTLKLKARIASGFEGKPEERSFTCVHNGGDYATYNVKAKFLWYAKVHYSGWYEIPTRATIPQELGFYNPLYVGWELLRFSWLVDCVIDIGGWFTSMMAAQGTHFLEGTRSELRQARFVEFEDAPDDGVVAGTPVASQLNGLHCNIEADRFVRTLIGPGGVFPSILPGMKDQMGVGQLANALSALTTLVGSRSRVGLPDIT